MSGDNSENIINNEKGATLERSSSPMSTTYDGDNDSKKRHPVHDSNCPNISSFILLKDICDNKISDDDDSNTVNASNSEDRVSTRMTIMFSVPAAAEDDDDSVPPLQAIDKMNGMISSLINKLPSVRIGPWLATEQGVKKRELLKKLPSKIDVAEHYVHGYNRFISAGQRGYCRLQLFHPTTINKHMISNITSTFKKPRQQFFELSKSTAPYPISVCTLTGSVQAMSESQDFYRLFKKKFNLQHLGLWWAQPRVKLCGGTDFNRSRFALHVEINNEDSDKIKHMKQYFSHSSKKVDHNMLGVPMTFVPILHFDCDDEDKRRIVENSQSQEHLGNSIKSTTISGVNLNNWFLKKKKHTLLRKLMTVESIYEKKLAKSTGSRGFKGRLFYAIITDSSTKSATFYYSSANYNEGRSVSRAIACFIKDNLEVDPAFYCTSQLIADSLNGEWDNKQRIFLTEEEKAEKEKLGYLEVTMKATNAAYISSAHQRALAAETDDVSLDNSRLTKGDEEPSHKTENSEVDEVSDLTSKTGSTRESKAKRYAEAAVKEVSKQYSETIEKLNNTIDSINSQKEEKDSLILSLLAKVKDLQAPSTETANISTSNTEGVNIDDDQGDINQQDNTNNTPIDTNRNPEKDTNNVLDQPLFPQNQSNNKILCLDSNSPSDPPDPPDPPDSPPPPNTKETQVDLTETTENQHSPTSPTKVNTHSDNSNTVKGLMDLVDSPVRNIISQVKSPFRKGVDSKDDHSIADPGSNKCSKLVSPDGVVRRSSSRLRGRTPTLNGNESGRSK